MSGEYKNKLKDGASALIIHKNKVLLFLRDDTPTISYPNHWGLPGGGIDEGETPVEAIKRELVEEVSYSPEKLVLIGEKIYGPTHTAFLFISFVDDKESKFFKHAGLEGQDVRFFTREEILNLKVTPVVRKYISEYDQVIDKMISEKYIPKASELDLL